MRRGYPRIKRDVSDVTSSLVDILSVENAFDLGRGDDGALARAEAFSL